MKILVVCSLYVSRRLIAKTAKAKVIPYMKSESCEVIPVYLETIYTWKLSNLIEVQHGVTVPHLREEICEL